MGLPPHELSGTDEEVRREAKSIHRARMKLNTFSLLLPSLLLMIPVSRAQPWPELGASYDIAAFEPVSPAVLGPRESVFLGHGTNDIQGQPSEPVNFLGSGFAVADVNGDGRNDLIVASPRANFTNRNHSGSVWIWFGTGTTGMRDAAGLIGTAPNVRILGADVDDGLTWMGNSGESNTVLSAGDCTGDGIADIVLHSQEASGPGNTRSRAGEGYLFFGRTTWPSVIDLANPTTDAKADVVIYGESNNLLGNGTGGKLADLNDDGMAEVIMFAPGRGSTAGRPGAGEVLIFWGRAAAAWPAVIDLAATGGSLTRILGPLTFQGIHAGVGEYGGVGAADINNDGFNDLILTAGDMSATANRTSCGGAYILFGKEVWPEFIDLETTTAAPHADVRIFGIDQSDNLGKTSTILTGDCDGDGLPDLVLSADLADGPANGRSGAGEAYLIWGRTTWPAVLDLAVAGSVGVTIYGASAGGLNGDRLTRRSDNHDTTAIGDVNGDGRADLLLATPQGDGPDETRTAAGEVYLILGRPRAAWPAVIDALPSTAAEHPDCIIYGQGPVPGSGVQADRLADYGTLAVGDVSGDGLDDILVAAPHRYLTIAYQPTQSTFHGMAFLIKGRAGAWPASIDVALAAGTPGGPDTSFRGGAYSRLGLGGGLGLGDLDDDGGLDVILGSPEYSYYPNGKLGVADEPGDRSSCGGLWVFAGATPATPYSQALAQLPTLAASMQFAVLIDGSATFSYERDSLLATQVLYTAEGSPDLITWTAMPVPPQIVSLGNGFERVTHILPLPLPASLHGKVVVTALP
jgi:hypothetical protein